MPREHKTTAADMHAASDRVLVNLINGNIRDALDELSDLPAVVAAYVAISVYERASPETRSHWLRCLARRGINGPG